MTAAAAADDEAISSIEIDVTVLWYVCLSVTCVHSAQTAEYTSTMKLQYTEEKPLCSS